MRVWIVVGIVLLAIQSFGAKSSVNVSGVVQSSKGPAAVVNGRLCRINDTIGGGTITDINLDGVTISCNGKETVYPVANSGGSTKAGTAQKKPENGFAKWFQGLGKKRGSDTGSASPGSASGNSSKRSKKAAKNFAQETLKVPGNAGSLTLSEKMRWADSLLADEERKFRSVLSRCGNRDDFPATVKSLNRMSQAYSAEFNKLKLPCSGPSSYQSWKKSHAQRARVIRQRQSAEFKAAAKRLGATCTM